MLPDFTVREYFNWMNIIEQLFAKLRADKRKAFIPFLPAGDPDLALTQDLIRVVAGAGADLVEVGFPFSDPIADGPTIQASYTRALKPGLSLDQIFAATSAVRDVVPMMTMASYSLIWKRGPERFLKEAMTAGLSGAVVPDLPVEEAADLAKLSRDLGFALTLLVTPTTAPERAEKIVAACTGFVYVVSIVGITGQKSATATSLESMMTRLRNLTDRPLCLGFGISQPEHVQALAPLADGLIVGSALVKNLEPPADEPLDRAAAIAKTRELCLNLSRSFPNSPG
ncbi:MAG: tryptophan synthase subunit alpha [Fimbriiglobus sp.]